MGIDQLQNIIDSAKETYNSTFIYTLQDILDISEGLYEIEKFQSESEKEFIGVVTIQDIRKSMYFGRTLTVENLTDKKIILLSKMRRIKKDFDSIDICIIEE